MVLSMFIFAQRPPPLAAAEKNRRMSKKWKGSGKGRGGKMAPSLLFLLIASIAAYALEHTHVSLSVCPSAAHTNYGL